MIGKKVWREWKGSPVQQTTKTARQIIEARLGRELPPTRELRRDERTAVKKLAIELLKVRGKK